MRNRVVIEQIAPKIEDGQYAVKRLVGDTIRIEADIICDGHDLINAWVHYRTDGDKKWHTKAFKALGNDRWASEIMLEKQGGYAWFIEAWPDYALNWQHELKRKLEGGLHVDVELLDGLDYLAHLKPTTAEEKAIIKKCKTLFKQASKYEEALVVAQSPVLRALFEAFPFQTFVTRSPEMRIWVDRPKAGFSAWYEFFPRSASKENVMHSTFIDAIDRLPYVAEMGFDVVYFPPIHPIGENNRKGKNNAAEAAEGDVGSPWAIGSRLGGHKSINPDLGDLKSFKIFIAEAKKFGIEVAMDYALQCAPDHPYVKEHPDWFKWRPDGTVQYAENPPKKYQDILPIFFETADWENLWKELLSILYFWMDAGIKIFRVDNPHTKPFRFWKWLIAEVHKRDSEVIFLSEAFTRPKIMHQLAKVGFTHSYTYFTWRNSKEELVSYMHEICTDPSRQYFRPNFWPNTPDILPYELQVPNEATFIMRHFLAATLSSNYGMYGPAYENMAYRAVPGKEEYWDSEKYEVQNHVWSTQGKLKQVIKIVNQLRKHHPAFQDTFNWVNCPVDNDYLFAYLKQTGSDVMLCVVNLDTYHIQRGMVQVPVQKFLPDVNKPFIVKDLLTQASYTWHGSTNYVEINPNGLPFHCFQINI